MTTPVLPVLERPCEYCTGEAGDTLHRENREEWQAWRAEEASAYDEFAAEFARNHTPGNAYEAWLDTPRYRELSAKQPEELAERGCVECDWTEVKLTDAGHQILAFVRRHS